MNRREFVQLMGIASGASLLNSCIPERQSEKIIPYLVPPDDGSIPGIATYTHTTCQECPVGCGVAAKTVDYKVGKFEGIPGHPIGDGALCMRGQASLTSLYHPGRLKNPRRKGPSGDWEDISWDTALELVADAISGTMEKFDLFAKMKHFRIPGSQWVGNQIIAMGMLYFRLKDAL